ncbi:NUDIX domain-containing protein [Chloroflexia bacterium SDU3-3]|nr:NUDIX domain-containing protein [Chloroflexia bacterium SDU3-3]
MTVNYQRWLRSYVGHQRLLQLAAGAFIRDEQGHILLGRRADLHLWAPPSGVVQLDETPSATIIREVREETGLTITVQRLIGIYAGDDFAWTYANGDQAQIISMFFACQVVGGELRADKSEFLDLRYFAPDALPALMPRYVRIIQDALADRGSAYFD